LTSFSAAIATDKDELLSKEEEIVIKQKASRQKSGRFLFLTKIFYFHKNPDLLTFFHCY